MLTQNDDWECTAGRSELFPWKDYSDKEPELGLIESPRARASRLFGGTAARSWLMAIGMELPAQTVDHLARRVVFASVQPQSKRRVRDLKHFFSGGVVRLSLVFSHQYHR